MGREREANREKREGENGRRRREGENRKRQIEWRGRIGEGEEKRGSAEEVQR